MLMMIQVFWDVMPCLLVTSYEHFEEAQCLHLQGEAVLDDVTSHKTWTFEFTLVNTKAEVQKIPPIKAQKCTV